MRGSARSTLIEPLNRVPFPLVHTRGYVSGSRVIRFWGYWRRMEIVEAGSRCPGPRDEPSRRRGACWRWRPWGRGGGGGWRTALCPRRELFGGSQSSAFRRFSISRVSPNQSIRQQVLAGGHRVLLEAAVPGFPLGGVPVKRQSGQLLGEDGVAIWPGVRARAASAGSSPCRDGPPAPPGCKRAGPPRRVRRCAEQPRQVVRKAAPAMPTIPRWSAPRAGGAASAPFRAGTAASASRRRRWRR